MQEVLQLGPLMIRMDWLTLALSGLGGYAAMWLQWKRSSWSGRPVLDPLFNAVLIYFLVWKLSPLVLSPSILKEPPMYWLMVSGNAAGGWTGFVIGVIYLGRAWRKLDVPWKLTLDLLALGGIAAMLIYSLLGWKYGTATSLPWGISIEDPAFAYHPVNVYRLLVIMPMFIWLWRRRVWFGTGKWISNALTYLGMGLTIVSFFNVKTKWLLGLSGEQFVYVMMMVLGVILSARINNSKEGR
ncbi:hypothetical protein [Paenibacillus pinihumi]|uniref:hypothetical protein n=1 Tax=Paenibacillus pinihumi TaxID=669462 RepID=UPI0003F5B00C|nr:hypothetical protein [Paenibacillus pinihumi]